MVAPVIALLKPGVEVTCERFPYSMSEDEVRRVERLDPEIEFPHKGIGAP